MVEDRQDPCQLKKSSAGVIRHLSLNPIPHYVKERFEVPAQRHG